MEKKMETTTKTNTTITLTTSTADKLLQLSQEINHLGRVLHRKNKKIRNQHETLAKKNQLVRSLEVLVSELLDTNAKLLKENQHLKEQLQGPPRRVI